MDELHAAAAVLARAADSESEEGMELETNVHKPAECTASAPSSQLSMEGTDNLSNLPVDRRQGAEDFKVLTVP